MLMAAHAEALQLGWNVTLAGRGLGAYPASGCWVLVRFWVGLYRDRDLQQELGHWPITVRHERQKSGPEGA